MTYLLVYRDEMEGCAMVSNAFPSYDLAMAAGRVLLDEDHSLDEFIVASVVEEVQR